MLVNLATGLEDSERVTIAFLVAGAALERGREVAIFLTKEAVRMAEPGHAVGVACEGCPPLERRVEQFARAAASCWPARSASTRAGWTPTGSWPTPA